MQTYTLYYCKPCQDGSTCELLVPVRDEVRGHRYYNHMSDSSALFEFYVDSKCIHSEFLFIAYKSSARRENSQRKLGVLVNLQTPPIPNHQIFSATAIF